MKRGIKKPKPKKSKRLNVKEPAVNYDNRRPVFSFKHLRYGSGCCISSKESEDRTSIIDKLLKLSQFKWKHISSKPTTGLGYEAIPQHEFKEPFPSVVTPEVNILVFRYSDGGRIAGYRINDIYHILMVGKDLYDH